MKMKAGIGGEYIQDVKEITEKEVWTAIQYLKNEKTFGPDDIPVEVWKCLE